MGAICLLACLALRAVATYFVSFGCGLNSKEKIFIGLTWMAKATVQVLIKICYFNFFFSKKQIFLLSERNESSRN